MAEPPREPFVSDAGNPKHLAPELLRPEFGEFGPALDFYSLGFTALELLFGPRFDSLFPGTGEGAIDADIAWMRWHSSDDQLPPSKDLGLEIPDDISTVIDRLLVKQVDQRPKSANEIMQLLDDRPLVRVEVKPTTGESSSRKAFVANVREVGTRAAKPVYGSDDDKKPKKASRKKKQSNNKKISARKLLAQAKRPAFLYALCLAMVLAALFLIFPFGGSPPDVQARQIESEQLAQPVAPDQQPVPVVPEPAAVNNAEFATVTLYVNPASADVQIDGKAVESKEGSIEFDVKQNHDVRVKVAHDEFGTVEETVSWQDLAENYFLLSIELERLQRGPMLPPGLVAKVGTSFDPQSNLPQHAVSTVLSEDAPMEFVLVNPTVMEIGANPEGIFPWESPKFAFVQERAFYIATTETTISQYSLFHQRLGVESSGTAWKSPAKQWVNSFVEQDVHSELPATNMSQQQAASFARWIGGRLPTTSEREVAVTYEMGSSGNAENDNQDWQLFLGSELKPRPVAAGEKTALGLLNAMGNAAEWCSSESGQANVKGCSFANPPGDHIRPSWQSKENTAGERYIGIRVLVPVETVAHPHQHEKE